MIFWLLSDFYSQYYFQFSPFIFQANERLIWTANLHVHCSTDQNTCDRNFSRKHLKCQTWLPQGRKWSGEKISLRSGKSQGISLQVRGSFMVMDHHIGHEFEQQTDGGFSILFKHYCWGAINSCTLHVSRWKHKLIDGWRVGIRLLRGMLSPIRIIRTNLCNC